MSPSPALNTPWVPLWPLSPTVPAPVDGQWLKGSGGAMVWDTIDIAEVSGLQAALDAKQATSEKGAANGYSPLNASSEIPEGNLPDRLWGTAAYYTPGNNWNNAIENGWWMCPPEGNGPTADWYIGIVTRHNQLWITQEVWPFTGATNNTKYQRRMSNGAWGGWEPVMIQMTQAQYNAATKYANTLYIIVG